VGSEQTVRRQLAELLTAAHADELMVTTTVPEPEARLHSMRALRSLFGAADLPQGATAT
jgi:alkanesulfonate monooxygenase SsuD/methylene tetrahydromethanopterin reductase-like flavin-dependent oxidoreductase (luciferase family)